MPKKKRKKFPRLPSGFGSIRYLGEGRRNCYAVNPPSTIDALGHINRPAALCYVDDWYKGFAVLTAYKAGTYAPGMERSLEVKDSSNLDTIITRILADYGTIKGVEDKHPEIHEPTFKEVYEGFIRWKFDSPKGQRLSKSTRSSYQAAFNNCKPLYDRVFTRIKAPELQAHLDSIQLKHSSLELVLMLYKQMYKYAIASEICAEDKSRYVSISIPDDDEHGVPFSDADLLTLWQHADDEDVQMILIMCYSGWRISEFKTMNVNLEEKYFQGGMKTEAGKNRIVPIHAAIFPFVASRMAKHGCVLPITVDRFRINRFYPTLKKIGIQAPHTPHDCRHTFSALCERYGVRENDRKRMLGHAFSDVTNAVYGHRSLEDLRIEMDKIQIPAL